MDNIPLYGDIRKQFVPGRKYTTDNFMLLHYAVNLKKYVTKNKNCNVQITTTQ